MGYACPMTHVARCEEAAMTDLHTFTSLFPFGGSGGGGGYQGGGRDDFGDDEIPF